MYEVHLLSPWRTRLATLDQFTGLTYVWSVNNSGSWSITLPDELSSLMLQPDNIIEIWRRNSEGVLKFEMAGFMRRPAYFSQNGRHMVTLSGPGLLYLLEGRIVAYAAGTSQAAKTGYADDMIKDVISENLGSDATDSNRDLSVQGLTVQGNTGFGPSVSKRFAWKYVDIVCRDIAAESFQRGVPLYYDLVPQWSADVMSFEFRTYINQRGADRSSTSGQPLFFGEEFGNLENPSYTPDYWSEVTDVYAGGLGEGEDRTVEEVTDDRATRSVWNRREKFITATNEQSTTGLESAARAALNEGKPTVTFQGSLLSVPGAEYGLDWDKGDMAVGMYRDQQFDGWINKVQVSLSPSGEERIQAKLEVLV